MTDTATPELSHCKGCRMPMVWATTAKGKMIPLSPVRTVYVIHQGVAIAVPQTGTDRYVSHFEVCPAADRFSRKTP